MDLNLDNYELDDLLSLFKLRVDFSAEEFKAAKRIVLAVHPDKSGLDSKYFVFFSDAYKLLDFVNKTKHNIVQNYEPESNAAKCVMAKRLTESDDFLSKFNKLFEQHYVQSNEDRKGHGDWFKSDADLNVGFDARKRDACSIALAPIEAAGVSSLKSASLDGDNYVDLKRSYTLDTVIGVSDGDLQLRPTLEVLKQQRSVPLSPLRNDEAMSAKAETERSNDTRRAYKLVTQDQSAKRQNFWALLT